MKKLMIPGEDMKQKIEQKIRKFYKQENDEI